MGPDHPVLKCDACGRPGREYCSDCHLPVGECTTKPEVHDCPDCPGHGPRHDEGFVACPDHEPGLEPCVPMPLNKWGEGPEMDKRKVVKTVCMVHVRETWPCRFQPRRSFAFYDSRSGRRVGMASFPSAEWCERELTFYRQRDAKGGRPDLHDLLPHLRYIETTHHAFGSRPGDVIGRPIICTSALSDWIDWSPTIFVPLPNYAEESWRSRKS